MATKSHNRAIVTVTTSGYLVRNRGLNNRTHSSQIPQETVFYHNSGLITPQSTSVADRFHPLKIYFVHNGRKIKLHSIESSDFTVEFKRAILCSILPTNGLQLTVIPTVFSTSGLPCEFPRRRDQSECWKTIISHSSWWPKDSNSKKSCRGPKRQSRKCTTKQYQGSWCRGKQQHNAE